MKRPIKYESEKVLCGRVTFVDKVSEMSLPYELNVALDNRVYGTYSLKK